MSSASGLLIAPLAAVLLAASACRKQEPTPVEGTSAPAQVSAAPEKVPAKGVPGPAKPAPAAAKPPAKTASLPRQQPCDEAAAAVETGKPSNPLLSEDPTCAAGPMKP